jgi:hypothetical protein
MSKEKHLMNMRSALLHQLIKVHQQQEKKQGVFETCEKVGYVSFHQKAFPKMILLQHNFLSTIKNIDAGQKSFLNSHHYFS